MTTKIFLTIFITVLFAELGDKTQLATLLFATDKENPKLMVFLAAAAALVVASGLAVLIGSNMEKYVNPKYLSWVAGTGFILIGIWTIVRT
ncbi:MAG: TMEM165/GDT1 family protein [Deltaproteobacteria bacterium]|nr:TMEM165/GDT1 family protein [Deltaproteobacteria bacterium]MBW2649410.1 TMEM165/GDT1 family protein [Deltaproteobacteria bacterium]